MEIQHLESGCVLEKDTDQQSVLKMRIKNVIRDH